MLDVLVQEEYMKTALHLLIPVGFLSCQNALEVEFSKQIEMLIYDVLETRRL